MALCNLSCWPPLRCDSRSRAAGKHTCRLCFDELVNAVKDDEVTRIMEDEGYSWEYPSGYLDRFRGLASAQPKIMTVVGCSACRVEAPEDPPDAAWDS